MAADISVHIDPSFAESASVWRRAFTAAGVKVIAGRRRADLTFVNGPARRRRRFRPAPRTAATWMALGYEGGATAEPEDGAWDGLDAVICSDEDTRLAAEEASPTLIGRIFVIPRPGDDAMLRRIVERLLPRPAAPAGRSRVRLGLIGYNLKFFAPIMFHLEAIPWMETRVDEWPRFAVNDPAVTREIVEWSDLVMCEWCGPNAVYASRHKQPGQRLVTRLHRFELYRDAWRDVDIDAVDAVVTVAPHYRDLVVSTTGWPESKVVVIPNWVDDLELARPKTPAARFTLGMLGAGTARKRLDRAVEVLELLRRDDDRFKLRVKTEMPWESRWVWADEAERAHFDPLFARLETPSLAGAVTFDPFGPDVGAWLRDVGFVLSTSDDESFHLAPAEGMASGAVPVVWAWPGSEHVYDDRWRCSTVDEMSALIRACADPARWPEAGKEAQREVVASYGPDGVLRRWVDLFTDLLAGR